MIDCINHIKDLLVFESADDFYFLQILQRKKENPQLGSNSRVIKNYYITSTQYLFGLLFQMQIFYLFFLALFLER